MFTLLALICEYEVAFEGDDKILWPHGSSEQFTINSYHKEMYKRMNELDFPPHAIWKPKVSTKACFLAWAQRNDSNRRHA